MSDSIFKFNIGDEFKPKDGSGCLIYVIEQIIHPISYFGYNVNEYYVRCKACNEAWWEDEKYIEVYYERFKDGTQRHMA